MSILNSQHGNPHSIQPLRHELVGGFLWEPVISQQTLTKLFVHCRIQGTIVSNS